MPLYRVEYQVIGYIFAPDGLEARRLARDHALDIGRDALSGGGRNMTIAEVRRGDQIEGGWTAGCIPYHRDEDAPEEGDLDIANLWPGGDP